MRVAVGAVCRRALAAAGARRCSAGMHEAVADLGALQHTTFHPQPPTHAARLLEQGMVSLYQR
jgi:hypothetical protein